MDHTHLSACGSPCSSTLSRRGDFPAVQTLPLSPGLEARLSLGRTEEELSPGQGLPEWHIQVTGER